MKVSENCLRNFASKACRNILELDFDKARNGQLLAKTILDVEEQDVVVKKEIAFVVDEGMIKVRARTVDPEKTFLPKERTVFEMILGEPPELPSYDDCSDELESETIFMLETKEHAFEMILKVLGL